MGHADAGLQLWIQPLGEVVITADLGQWTKIHHTYEIFLVTQMVRETACNAGDAGSVPESGRFPGEGNGNPFQCS